MQKIENHLPTSLFEEATYDLLTKGKNANCMALQKSKLYNLFTVCGNLKGDYN